LVGVQSSEPLHAKMNPTSCLFGSWFACAQTAIFSAEPCSKNAGETSVVLWITACKKRNQHPTIQTIFHQIKVSQPIGGLDSMQTVIRTSRRLDSCLHEAAQNFEVFSNIRV
jgi:hypothetical protein